MAVGLLVASLLHQQPAVAQENVVVLDRGGNPVAGAVFWIDSPSTAPAAPDSAPVIIDQRDKRFEPFVTIVRPGTLVSFPNSDDIRHHVYSFSESKSFELKLYQANDAEPIRFDENGIVVLGCNIHDNMQAYLIVSERAHLGVTNEQGELQINAAAPAQIQVWHPFLDRDAIDVDLSTLRKSAEGAVVIDLPIEWNDPQAVRSSSQLESLLKQFSRDAS